MCTRTVYDARNNLSGLIKIAEGGEPVELTRHGKAVAVIISKEEFDKRNPNLDFFEKWEKLRAEFSDVLGDSDYQGLVIPRDEPPEEEYDKKIRTMWEEA